MNNQEYIPFYYERRLTTFVPHQIRKGCECVKVCKCESARLLSFNGPEPATEVLDLRDKTPEICFPRTMLFWTIEYILIAFRSLLLLLPDMLSMLIQWASSLVIQFKSLWKGHEIPALCHIIKQNNSRASISATSEKRQCNFNDYLIKLYLPKSKMAKLITLNRLRKHVKKEIILVTFCFQKISIINLIKLHFLVIFILYCRTWQSASQ